MSTYRIPRTLLLQAAIWIGLFIFFAFTGDTANRDPRQYFLILLRVALLAVLYNVQYHLVLPYYFRGRKRAFWLLAVGSLLAYIVVSVGLEFLLADTDGPRGGIQNRPLLFLIMPPLVIGLTISGIAASVRALTAFDTQKKAEEEANRRRLEAEIALLKSQINPHFLLNTINNLYALSLTEPDKTPDGLLKLSEMVSYILYECASPSVPLVRDLQFVESYISLQRLRLPPNATLNVSMPEGAPESLTIEPMILVPFIENAFKHGLTTKQPCTIDISIAVAGQRLDLAVTNLLLEKKEAQAGNPSGIGMTNTRQRLDHTYANRYDLQVNTADDRHRVELELDLA